MSNNSNSFAGVYVSTIFAAAFVFTVGIDSGIQSFYDRWNKGVRRITILPVTLFLTCSDLTPETMEGYPR